MDEQTKEFFLELEKARSKKGLGEKIGALTGFIGAMTGLVAAVFTIYLGIQTLNLQEQIEEGQKILDKNAENLSLNESLQDENARIGLIFIHHQQAYCTSLPIGDKGLWKEYASCLAGQKVDALEEFDFAAYIDLIQKFECLRDLSIPHCRGEAAN